MFLPWHQSGNQTRRMNPRHLIHIFSGLKSSNNKNKKAEPRAQSRNLLVNYYWWSSSVSLWSKVSHHAAGVEPKQRERGQEMNSLPLKEQNKIQIIWYSNENLFNLRNPSLVVQSLLSLWTKRISVFIKLNPHPLFYRVHINTQSETLCSHRS